MPVVFDPKTGGFKSVAPTNPIEKAIDKSQENSKNAPGVVTPSPKKSSGGSKRNRTPEPKSNDIKEIVAPKQEATNAVDVALQRTQEDLRKVKSIQELSSQYRREDIQNTSPVKRSINQTIDDAVAIPVRKGFSRGTVSNQPTEFVDEIAGTKTDKPNFKKDTLKNIEKLPTVLPSVAKNVTKKIIGPTDEVPIKVKRNIPKGTYFDETEFVDEIAGTKTDSARSQIPEFVGGTAAVTQYAVPVVGNVLVAAGTVSGGANIIEGVKTKDTSKIVKGSIEVLPAVTVGGVKAYQYLAKPVVRVTPLVNEVPVATGKGVVIKEGQITKSDIVVRQEFPDVYIEKTTRGRELLGLKPKPENSYWQVDKGVNQISKGLSDETGSSVSNVFTKKFGKGKVITAEESQSITKEVKIEDLFKQDRATNKVAKDFAEKFGVDGVIVSGQDNPSTFFVFEQQSKRGIKLPGANEDVRLLKANTKTAKADIVIEKRPATVIETPKSYGLAEVKPLGKIDEETSLFRVRVAGKETRSLLPQGKSKTTFQEIYVKAVEKPAASESAIDIIAPSGRKSSSQIYDIKQDVVKAVTNKPIISPSKTPRVSVIKTDTSTFELYPKIVGGQGLEQSQFFGKGGMKSNEVTQGPLSYSVSDYSEATVQNPRTDINILTVPRDKDKADEAIDFGLKDVTNFKDRTDTSSRDKIIESESTVTASAQGVASKQSQVQFIRNILKAKRMNEPLRISNKPSYYFNPKGKSKPKKRNIFQKAYDVIVFKKGKEEVIAEDLPIGLANKAGVKEILSTLRASYKLKESGKTSKEDIDFYVPSFLTKSKTDAARIVQPRNLRLGSGGETSEIKFFKRRKGASKWFT